jgi:hypothetical protein
MDASAKLPYAGVNDQDTLYPGNMVKIVVLYAAFPG